MKKPFSIKSSIIIVASLIGIIATFLPWISTSVLGVNISARGSDGDGWISLIGFVVALSIAIVEVFKKEMWTKIVITIAAAIAIIVMMIDMISGLNEGFTIGAGIYLGLIAGLACVIVPWLPIDKKN